MILTASDLLSLVPNYFNLISEPVEGEGDTMDSIIEALVSGASDQTLIEMIKEKEATETTEKTSEKKDIKSQYRFLLTLAFSYSLLTALYF